jgi:hypothetical protein
MVAVKTKHPFMLLRKNGGRKIIRSAIDFAKITAKLSNNGKCLNI